MFLENRFEFRQAPGALRRQIFTNCSAHFALLFDAAT